MSGGSTLTSAGVWVLSLGRPPRKVMVEIPAALTVQALCVVLAHAASVDLANQNVAVTIDKQGRC